MKTLQDIQLTPEMALEILNRQSLNGRAVDGEFVGPEFNSDHRVDLQIDCVLAAMIDQRLTTYEMIERIGDAIQQLEAAREAIAEYSTQEDFQVIG